MEKVQRKLFQEERLWHFLSLIMLTHGIVLQAEVFQGEYLSKFKTILKLFTSG